MAEFIEALPDERGGYRLAQPITTAPHFLGWRDRTARGRYRLAPHPMASAPEPAPISMPPVVRHPTGVGIGWIDPASRPPYPLPPPNPSPWRPYHAHCRSWWSHYHRQRRRRPRHDDGPRNRPLHIGGPRGHHTTAQDREPSHHPYCPPSLICAHFPKSPRFSRYSSRWISPRA